MIYKTVRENLRSIHELVIEYLEENEDFGEENVLNETWILVLKNGKPVYYSDKEKAFPLTIDIRNIQKEVSTVIINNEPFRMNVSTYQKGKDTYLICCAVSVKEREHELNSILLSTVFGIIIFITIIFISGYFFSIAVLKPFNTITLKMNQITSENLSERFPIREEKDEINRLKSSVNELLNRLENSFNLQKYFIADVSHELKTPLSIARLSIESVVNDHELPQNWSDNLNRALNVLYTMNFLIKKLLLLARLDEVKNPLSTGPTDLVEIMDRIEDNLSAIAQDKKIDLIVEKDTTQIMLNADRELLYIAIYNIVENAVKYTAAGTIYVRMMDIGNIITIEIRDTGPGIPGTDLDNIFNRFYRSENNVQSSKGYGIGLSISKKIIILHGGKIKVSSRLNEGTVFQIKLGRMMAPELK